MKESTWRRIVAPMAFGALGVVAPQLASANGMGIKAELSGYEEVPTLSTPAEGRFKARIDRNNSSIQYELSYADLESAVTQAHIHFGARGTNGSITVFLCTNLGNGPAGTQACPPAPATITGTIVPADVGAGAAGQGLGAGEFDELILAIREGVTYANVHTVGRPGGEVRGQIR